MDEQQYRFYSLVLLAASTCIAGVVVGVRIVLKNMVDGLVRDAAQRQLLSDFKSMREGRPLQGLHSTPAATSKALLTAMCNRV